MRGCRCIEIDVHNGEAPDDKSIENLSLSPSLTPSSPRPEHKHQRHISGSTLSSRAAAAFEKADEKYETAKRKLAGKIGRDGQDKDDRGRQVTSSSLEVNQPAPRARASSVRSTMSGEPLVLHGWTLTAPIGFRAVCKSIREAAFVTSKLPLIVSLEVHADADQQEVMVDIMREEWAGVLVDVPHEGCDPEKRLPRLEELQEKILIKVKKAVADKQDPIASASTLAPTPSKTDSESISGSEDERGNGKKKVKICDNLSNLGIYTHSEHFTSFEVKSATRPSHIYSIGENQIQELHQNQRNEMFAHNRDFFMRAYPAGFRIDSSNLDPSEFWRKGVQMVALNWQKLDEGMMLNEGMFAGENGWVLKPPGYRSDATEAIQYKTLDLKITVFAGQHIPIPPDQTEKGFHPYIKCELHVEKEQEHGSEPKEPEERKRKTPYSKGDHPDFGDEGCVLQFPTQKKIVEELSFVRLVHLLSLSQVLLPQTRLSVSHQMLPRSTPLHGPAVGYPMVVPGRANTSDIPFSCPRPCRAQRPVAFAAGGCCSVILSCSWARHISRSSFEPLCISICTLHAHCHLHAACALQSPPPLYHPFPTSSAILVCHRSLK